MKRLKAKLITAGMMLALSLGMAAQTAPDPLRSGFDNPPQSASPRVWWHWMNGNITKEGIKLDLEWMHRVGVVGYQNFDANLDTPQVVAQRLTYMSPGWKDAFKYAITLGHQLGMEEAVAGSPGWSESGGPWVPASQGMKKYVWSETDVEGGRPFVGQLNHPPTVTGAFQTLVQHNQPLAPGTTEPQFYRDAAVVAYRRPAGDVPLQALHPQMTASAGSPDFAVLEGADLEKTTQLPVPAAGQSAWIQYAFEQPVTIHAITYVTPNPNRNAANRAGFAYPVKTLQASDDGVNFRVVAELPDGGAPEHTIAFPAVTAKVFRVNFMQPEFHAPMGYVAPATPAAPITDYQIAELILHSGAYVNHFEDKGAFVPVLDLYEYATPAVDPADAIAKTDVIDLTAKMRADGTLDWTPPPGHWVVLRFGFSLIGITNHPASPEATGLEVDKLNGPYVKNYMEHYLNNFKETVGPDLIGKQGLHYVVNDSWEAGSQNWTDDMIEQFKKLRGYDPTPWLPVLAGRVVESAAASDRFLWDFRETIGDLITTEHYGELEAVLHEWGMGHYSESHEGGRAFVADGMAVKKYSEVPMGALWTQTPGVVPVQYGYNADDRESASVAHIYGQNIAAAESMTTCSPAAWAWSPGTLKPFADAEFTNGINRFVIHESAHQPLVDKAPGLTLGNCGQWFNRNDTWAEEAGPWVKYLARTSFLLQQGHFGADLVYFYGEDSNLTAIFRSSAPNIPEGYGFDYINADALMHELRVVNGRLVTPGGMNYRVLGLDPYSQHMSLPVLRAIDKLVEAGAVVSGPKPIDDPSLADDQQEFARLSGKLFGDGSGVHSVGKGKVYAGGDLSVAFQALNLPPDFAYTKPESDTNILFVHRKLATGDVYFLDNRNNRTEQVDATFRVTGKEPQLWHSDTGRIEPVSYKIAEGRTTIPLKLEPWGSVFVVFRKPTQQMERTLPAKTEAELATIEGPWKLSFQPDRGAPAAITLDTLSAWNDSADEGVRYFSGIGTYSNTLNVRAEWMKKGAHLWLDLGDVHNLAEVTVNGKPLGQVWHTPYRVEVTSAVKPGANQVVIKVTNAWVNRLIGDQQPDATRKYTFTTVKPYNAHSPLQESGLLGPVTLESVTPE